MGALAGITKAAETAAASGSKVEPEAEIDRFLSVERFGRSRTAGTRDQRRIELRLNVVEVHAGVRRRYPFQPNGVGLRLVRSHRLNCSTAAGGLNDALVDRLREGAAASLDRKVAGVPAAIAQAQLPSTPGVVADIEVVLWNDSSVHPAAVSFRILFAGDQPHQLGIVS